MASLDEEDKMSDHTTNVEGTKEEEDANGAPLMVAMQPTAQVQEVQIGDSSMIEVQEVVVVTDAQGNGDGIDLKDTIDLSSGQLVPVGAEEEIEEIVSVVGRFNRLGDIKEPIGPSRRRPSTSTEGSGTEESESDAIDFPITPRQPKKREFAHRLQWRSRDMLDAMKAVEDKKTTIRGAAKKFNVPYSTLKDRVHGRVRHGTKPGVKTILSPEEEEELVKYIRDMEASGFQMRHVDVRDRAGELLRLNHGHNTPYKEGSPGHNWLGGFLKRHPGLEFRRTLQRNMIPSAAKQKQMLKRFYDIAGQIYKKYRLHHKAERIFVVSEFRVRLTQHATILIAASADGTVIPPFVVFHGQKLKLSSARQAYPEAFFTCSFNGFINDDIFLWWFRDHFLKKVTPGNRPFVLFLSRSVTDISLQLAQRAKEERVYLVAIPPQVSHLVNPIDDELASETEAAMIKKANKWHEENENFPFTQKVFAEILRKAWKKCITAEELTRKFCQNGIFPLCNTAISADRILNATQLMREAQQKAASAASVKQDPLAGLSLLSALSSHEYASLGHMYNSNENLNRSFDTDDLEPQAFEADTPVATTPAAATATRHSPRRPKRRRWDGEDDDEILPPVRVKIQVNEDTEVDKPDSKETKSHFKMSEELMKHVLDQPTGKRGRGGSSAKGQAAKQQERGGDVQSEIVAARENIEQINRAIDSILEKAAQDEALKKSSQQQQKAKVTPRSPRLSRVKYQHLQGSRDDQDAAEHLVKTEIMGQQEEIETEEVVEEEVVGAEQVVEEQIVEEPQEEEHQLMKDEVEVQEEVVNQEEEEEVASTSHHQPPTAVSTSPTKTDVNALSVNQLMRNKRTILVETVIVNGQKVKIVRMAPAEPQGPRTIKVPPSPVQPPQQKPRGRPRGSGRGRGRPSSQPPKITIIKAPTPRSRSVVVQPPQPQPIPLDMVVEQEEPAPVEPIQEVVMDGEVIDHGIQYTEQQPETQYITEDELLAQQQQQQQQLEQGEVVLEPTIHEYHDGSVITHAVVTEDGIIQVPQQQEAIVSHDGVLEQQIGEDGGFVQVVQVSQPHLVDEHGVPAQIFEQEEQPMGQDMAGEPQQILLQEDNGEIVGENPNIEDEEQSVMLQEIGDGSEELPQHVIQQDENGVQFVEVFNPTTGQHEQIILQQQIME